MENKIITLEELVAWGDDLRVRQMSAVICASFEDALANDDIYIPNDEREGDEDEACLYGDDYTYIEDSTTNILSTISSDFDSAQVKGMAHKICGVFAYFISSYNLYLDDVDVPKAGKRMTTTRVSLEEKVEEWVARWLEIVQKNPGKPFNTEMY